MAPAQVVETSVNTNNSPSQDYTTNPDDHSNHNIDSPGFKPFTVIEKVNERALRLMYKDKTFSYTDLLSQAKQPTLANRRIQDMMLVINKYFNKTVPAPISELLEKRSTSYNLRGQKILSIPKARRQFNEIWP